jgi:hypothetical protein
LTWFQVEDDMFAHAANSDDTAVFEGRGDCRRGRLQRLFLLAQPDRFNDLSRDPFGKAAGDGFDFGQFRHGCDYRWS